MTIRRARARRPRALKTAQCSICGSWMEPGALWLHKKLRHGK